MADCFALEQMAAYVESC